ncbi:putative 2-hydroxyphytanoyl-CoA lyase [Ascobolus immersus RN42]|uniref:2-hydroxyacyl-CoA lyase n=1 Tax=Ascobolus immersus RN42 TaxID=1160509 RepID=A0A3N4I911_ASCIM|nr:putative 2-hydroxyphytanoyl-CoA lyase [Ascobolus immersus RN42]
MAENTPNSPTGAQLIAKTLQHLEVKVIFGIVGIPIIEVAEACIALGIRFIAFRNEQAASYAASAYGYLTGRPGVLLVVGGPGVVHALSGIHSSQKNFFPLLTICGSHPSSHLSSQGSFQSLQTTTFLSPHTKLTIKPPKITDLPKALFQSYSTAFWGRPGATCVEVPGDFVTNTTSQPFPWPAGTGRVSDAPRTMADPARIQRASELLASGKNILVVIGKGAAYARSEHVLREFIDKTGFPFLPTPMGKGVLPDSHPLNVSAARSYALKNAEVVLVLGARLNWILHFGDQPKWNKNAVFIRVDMAAEELPINTPFGQESLSLNGDITLTISQLLTTIRSKPNPSPYLPNLKEAISQNEQKAAKKHETPIPKGKHLTYHRTFHLIQQTLHSLSPPEDLIYISEGANTMDISRSILTLSAPRQRMDAGTDATMGLGLGYSIAAWEAYCGENLAGGKKKVIALEGDSAFGFSAMEIETMARYHMDVLIFVMNNGGVYHGENYPLVSDPASTTPPSSSSAVISASESWQEDPRRAKASLPPTALSYGTRYDLLAKALGGEGYYVTNEEELVDAVQRGYHGNGPVVVNVAIASGGGGKLEFAWLKSEKESEKSKL